MHLNLGGKKIASLVFQGKQSWVNRPNELGLGRTLQKGRTWQVFVPFKPNGDFFSISKNWGKDWKHSNWSLKEQEKKS